MDKAEILKSIQGQLEAELAALHAATKAARDAATHEESKAEDEHDTRAIEASYLAGAQSKRAGEIEASLTLFRNLNFRNFGPGDAIAATALVEVESGKTRALYLIAPQGGGLTVQAEGKTIHLLTPKSPLGDELLGRKQGDSFSVETPQGEREYRILQVI